MGWHRRQQEDEEIRSKTRPSATGNPRQAVRCRCRSGNERLGFGEEENRERNLRPGWQGAPATPRMGGQGRFQKNPPVFYSPIILLLFCFKFRFGCPAPCGIRRGGDSPPQPNGNGPVAQVWCSVGTSQRDWKQVGHARYEGISWYLFHDGTRRGLRGPPNVQLLLLPLFFFFSSYCLWRVGAR